MNNEVEKRRRKEEEEGDVRCETKHRFDASCFSTREESVDPKPIRVWYHRRGR